MHEDTIRSAVSSTFFYRQPYDLNATFDASESVIGAVSSLLYPSPSSPLLEAIDVGFRGMSGAIAIDTSTDEPMVLGMLSRRAKPNQLKLDRIPLANGLWSRCDLPLSDKQICTPSLLFFQTFPTLPGRMRAWS